MKPFEEQFSAWVDDQLSGEELAQFERDLATHPEALEDKQDALRLRKLLREHPVAPRLSNPDFFNHQLLQRIAAESPKPALAPEKKRVSFWSLPRLAFAGAFCLVTSFGLFKAMVPVNQPIAGTESKYFAQVVEAWPSDPSISATTVYNKEDNVTVLWLDGLDYIPATYALK